MRLARLIDEASVELAVVESVVDTARKVVDTAADAERVTRRIAARVRTAAAIIVGGVAIVGLAYGAWSLLEHRRTASPRGDEMPVDEASAEING